MDLKIILNDLNRYKRDRNELLAYYVEERLNKSLETYYKELNSQLTYLKNKDSLRVAKNMS